ncbi:hypothetical protein BKA69DRAFT_186019 [Paraphysoderma sedebokerense]|nr:hypothetical protein BKA69DRAFT_186019 [Paraphysoderma sedebokerense]
MKTKPCVSTSQFKTLIQVPSKFLPFGFIFDNDGKEISNTPHIFPLTSTYLYKAPENRHGQPPEFFFTNITFAAFDGNSFSATTGVFSIHIRPINDAPVTRNLSVSMDRDPTMQISLICNDVDNVPTDLAITITKAPLNGTLNQHDAVANGPGEPVFNSVTDLSGMVWFVPNRDFVGKSSFSYECKGNSISCYTARYLIQKLLTII